MGTVYRGVDPRLGRPVAIKLLKGGDPDVWHRFLAEARALAQIEHENVCRVYEAGEIGGEPFIAMQYIDGEPLSEIAAELTLDQRVRVMQRIAMAVHEAHRVGIIHRDIKPANILIERQEGGALKPYILDFGLARQVGQRGQTQTGVVVGTLTYMPPEQARGDWQAMDRRSDVYSLGATLFDLIAGRPPFQAEHPMKLLMMVTYGDAPRLGEVAREAPKELETIVMKCLEREPARRYESARTLADDLQRFLDREPILARPPSIRHVVWKKVRKHRLATAVLAAIVAGALVLAGVWLRARREAEERARIAHDLGVAVTEMELFLRAAYEMPLHDVERERDLVRARLAELEQRMAAAGEAGEAPAHCALGQGHLALGDPERAREHLEKALAAGYSSPELRYALGRALGELFRQALAETKRITNQDERRKRVAELEAELRDPALSHLRAAAGSKIGVPAYVEGLIALYEGKHEEAVTKAREAFLKAPWMYEAKKLEGDALFAEGSKHRHDAAFDLDKMKAHFDPAARAYAVAADIGRSDPDVHLAECELWEKMGWAASAKGMPFEQPFDAAEASCRRAVEASSNDGRALVQRALVLSARAYAEKATRSPGALAVVEDARGAAEESAAARPWDPMAHYAVALALYQRALVVHELGGEASMEAAIEAYERVLEMAPRFTWALNELGDAYRFEAEREQARGGDGAVWVESAIRRFEQAIAIDPGFALPVAGRLRVLAAHVESRIERGQDAEAPLGALFAAVGELDKASFGPWLAALWKARAHRLRAQHDLARGADPRAPLEAALSAIRAFAGDAPEDPWLLAEMARCHLLEATYALDEGLDPQPSLARARDAVRRAGEGHDAVRLLPARIEDVAARAAAKGEPVRPATRRGAPGRRR